MNFRSIHVTDYFATVCTPRSHLLDDRRDNRAKISERSRSPHVFSPVLALSGTCMSPRWLFLVPSATHRSRNHCTRIKHTSVCCVLGISVQRRWNKNAASQNAASNIFVDRRGGVTRPCSSMCPRVPVKLAVKTAY